MENFVLDLQIVQQKFKQREKVLVLFEVYQIIGSEHINRLLALVTSTGTYAVFSFNVGRLPPETISDLSIDKIFPINESFQFGTDSQDVHSALQFYLKNSNEKQETFYYYPLSSSDNINDFNKFQTQIVLAKSSFEAKHEKEKLQNQVETMNTTSEVVMRKTELSFDWLKAYQQSNPDLYAIDRSIADGTKRLKKGESKFQDELKKREKEYMIHKDYRIYCATWNINGQPCKESVLSLWLAASENPPDIYVIALQEMDLSTKAITISENRPNNEWNRRFMENLHPSACYEELKSVRLVGMMLTIFVRKELRPSFVRHEIQAVPTGTLNFGNKGGVAVSVTFNDASLCFVNSHLAAHLNEVELRNQHYSIINKKCTFGDVYDRRTISQHDHIFWIGDLNYRIEEFPGQRHDHNNYERLLVFDQLRMEMRKENVFHGYVEGDIKFCPTYKYDVGTNNYDSSEKSRSPAYCDRVLWKGPGIRQVQYNSVMDIKESDHKPVYAEFVVAIRTRDEKLFKRVHEETLKRVDKYENDNQPQITVEKTEIDFDEVTFNELYIRDFTVANNCHLPVEFSFKQTHSNDKQICEKWLDVEPKSGSLITGSSLSIRIKFLADSKTVADFSKKINTSQKREIFDILVLHVKDGHDVFISIIGKYIPSCYGLPLETLCLTNRPVIDYTLEELNKLTNIHSFKVGIPREVYLLIDYLYKMEKETKAETVFLPDRKYAKNEQINQIRDWLDSWSSKEFPGNGQTAAEALLTLLEASNEPLLKPFASQLLRTTTLEEAMEFIKQLSAPRCNTFLHLCLFLRDGICNRNYNIDDIATIFGNILLKKKSEQVDGYQDGRCRLLMLRFLQSDLGILTRVPNCIYYC